MAQSMQPSEDEGPEGGSILDTLQSKVGGIPVWVLFLALVALVYWYLKKKQSSSTSGTATTGTGTSTGTSNALTSNLVGVSEPVPVLDGTYQVTVSPENAPNSIYASTNNSSTQGIGSPSTPASNLNGTSASDTAGNNAANTTNVQPQTQSSSPQTQAKIG